MYDALAEAVPLAARATIAKGDGRHLGRQRHSSRTGVRELKQLIRDSEVLVYAVGIDGEAADRFGARRAPGTAAASTCRCRFRFRPEEAAAGGAFPAHAARSSAGGSSGPAAGARDDRVNVVALRDMTDDSGGRTESFATRAISIPPPRASPTN